MSPRALIASTTVALTAFSGVALAQDAPADGVKIPRPAPGANQSAAPAAAGFDVDVSGYIRVQYQSISEDSSQTPFVGRNDGFAVDSARLVIDARRGPLQAYLSIDGAVDRFDAANTTLGRVDVGLKDAYIGYARDDMKFLMLKAGQFKPPFDAEEDRSTRDILFVDRAVESRGVRGAEGYTVEGLSLDRQAGLLVYGEPEFGELGLGYFFAITNGSGANRPSNDNDLPAYTGRVEVRWADMVTAGAAFNLNQLTTGDDVEDLIDEEILSIAADLSADIDLGAVGLIVQAQYMQRTASFPDVEVEQDRVSNGYHAALGLEVPYGFTLAYRYAFLDPTAEFESEDSTAESVFDTDAVTHHTIGLNWEGGEALPLKLQFNYTLAQEDEGPRQIDNDRIDALMQVVF